MANEYDVQLESNEYDAQIAQDEGRKALRASMVPALESKPDTFAEAKRLGTAGGVPAEVVERNIEPVRKQAALNEYDRLLVESPALAKHLTDRPDFARLAHDDTENLSLTERVTKSFKRGLQGTLRGNDAMALQESAEIMGLLDRMQRGEFADQAALEQASPYGRFFAGVSPEQFPQVRAHQEERFLENAVEFAIRSGKIAGLPPSEEYARFQQMGRDYGFMEGAIPAVVFQPKVLLDIVSESLGALAPSLPLILGGGAAGGVPGLAAATGASSTFTEFTNALPAVFDELGVDLTDRAAVTAAVQTLEFKEKVRSAALKAGIIGAFDAATAGAGALRLRPSAGGNLAAQTAVQGAGGAAGEATGSVAAGQEIDPSSVVAEAVGEVPTATIDAGILAARRQVEMRQKAQAAEQDAEVLTEIGELAKASKVAQRDPASFQAFVDAAAAEGPVQDVYIDAKVLAETLQQDGLAELAQVAPTAAAQIPEALASGGSVRIPLGEYATGIAATDLNTKLLPHLKTDPAGMSQVEAQEYMQGEAEAFKQEAEQILAEKQADDVFVQSAAKVESTVLEQLTTANRFTADVNKAYAALTRDFYVTTAARVGVTPEELYARYPLQIRAESVAGEGLDQGHLARLKAGDIEVPESGFSTEDKRGFGDLHRRGLANVVERDGKKFLTLGRGLWYEEATDAQQATLNQFEGDIVEFADYEFIPSGDDIYEAADAQYASSDVAPRLREIPISMLGDLGGYDQPKEQARIEALAEQIKATKQIAPVFVALESNGQMFVAEGQHRVRALRALGHKVVPARVIVDLTGERFNQSVHDQFLDDMVARGQVRADPDAQKIDLRKFADDLVKERAALKGNASPAATARVAQIDEELEQSAVPQEPQPVFYSGLTRAVESVKQPKAPASQWMGMLKNQPGVKAEELEWTGLEEWLGQQEGSVSKEAVLDFLRANEIKVEEKELQGASDIEFSHGEFQEEEPDADFLKEQARDLYLDNIKQDIADRDDIPLDEVDEDEAMSEAVARATNAHYNDPERGAYKSVEATVGGRSFDFRVSQQYGETEIWDESNKEGVTEGFVKGMDEAQVEQEIREYLEKKGLFRPDDATQYGSYTLPGAKEGSYRELLLTLPDVAEMARQSRNSDFLTLKEDVATRLKQEMRSLRNLYDARDQGLLTDDEKTRLAAIDADAEVKRPEAFRSSHFDIPNILAHVRFNERTDADGKRVLFIEEVQSDWHQKGRRLGYKQEVDPIDTSGWTVETVEDNKYTGQRFVIVRDAEGNKWSQRSGFRGTDAEAIADAASAKLANDSGNVDRVPDAPFKTTWPMLAMKRALRWAVDNGYDRIAWTTGEQQADRYDLSKKISKILYNAPGGRMAEKYGTVLKAFDMRGEQVINEITTPEELPDVIGKDAADKLLKSEPKGSQHELSGLDLKVGGEGMAAFYDKMLPSEMNRYTKKWGGKVGTTKIAVPESKIKFEDRGKSAEERGVYPAVHSLDITPQMREAALAGQAMFQGSAQAPRGSFNPNTKTIALLKNADLSTFLHESGHFYLEVLADLAAQPDSPVAGDMQAVLDWFGVKDLATWQAMSLNEKRPHHEKFARGFEAYLFENKAPSVEMKGLFARFRSWLLNVYKSLTALNVELSDEVRGVFDRLIASEQQIREAETAAGAVPLFTEPAPGMKPEEFASYQALGAEATSDAVSDLQRRSLRDMQWLTEARGRTLKTLQRDAASKRKAVEKEVAAEVAAMPVYSAMRFLKTGELPDGRTLDAHRLQVSAIEEMYPKGRPSYDWQDLGKGAGGMTGVNGITPDAAAELLGYTSGDHLIRDILAAQPQEQVVEGMTDQRMLERYGDLATPEALQRAANEAVHNDARMRFVTAELNALAKATGGRKVLAKAAKDFAAAIVARKRVRDIKPSQYTVAEARASQEAEKALKAGNLTEAAAAKRNQLVNGYAGRAAHEAVDEVEKGVRYLRKFAGPTSLDPDYAEQIHALLGRFDLRRITNREADRRATLAKWVESQQELGFEPVIDEALLDEAAHKPYRDMTVEEFRGLVDTVRNIEHLGRLKKKLLTAANEREFQAAVDEAAASIRANAKGKKPVKLESNTKLDAAAEGVGEFFAMHRKLASLLRELDGFKDGGAMWELLMRPLNKASDAEAVMREKATMALDKLFSEKITKGARTKVYIPEIGASLSKEGRLAVALNWGNADNRQRVMEGDGWAPQQVQAILNTLTKDEWDFVQGVWDYVDSFWPEIVEKEKRVSGVAPDKVVATPVETPFGTYRGGYYPIKYDPRRSSKAESHSLAESVKQSMLGLYTRATTRRGHTKARAEEVSGRPVRKDLGVVFEHITQVAHDLKFHEYLIDANRLLRASAIDGAIREHYGPEVLRQLKNAMTDVAAGDVPAQDIVERSVNHIRTGATIAGLAWNLTTAMLQPLGLTQSMVRIGPKWVGRGMARWLRNARTMESTTDWIYDRSDFMRLRGKTMQREISEIRNKVSGKEGAVQASFFYLIQQMQKVADIPTWLGAYEKAMEADPDEARAIALADQAVLDSQGGGQIKDLAGVQRGGPLKKLWTNFYSYFNVTYNLAAERTKATKFSDPGQVGMLAVDYLLLFTVPAALGAVVRTALKPGEDWDDLPERVAREHLNYLFGTMVGLRELGAGINGFAGYTGPAGIRFFAEINKLARDVGDGDWSEAAEKALVAGGILFHLPVGQIERTAEGVAALVQGDTKNPLAVITGPPR